MKNYLILVISTVFALYSSLTFSASGAETSKGQTLEITIQKTITLYRPTDDMISRWLSNGKGRKPIQMPYKALFQEGKQLDLFKSIVEPQASCEINLFKRPYASNMPPGVDLQPQRVTAVIFEDDYSLSSSAKFTDPYTNNEFEIQCYIDRIMKTHILPLNLNSAFGTYLKGE